MTLWKGQKIQLSRTGGAGREVSGYRCADRKQCWLMSGQGEICLGGRTWAGKVPGREWPPEWGMSRILLLLRRDRIWEVVIKHGPGTERTEE